MEILELRLLSPDLEQTKTFYSDVLDLACDSQSENSLVYFAGKSKLIFNASTNREAIHHVAFSVPDDKLEAAYEWLRKRIPIVPIDDDTVFADFNGWNARAFYFYDLHQNILEFISRIDVPDPGPVNHPFIRSIAEMGIVAPAIQPALDKLKMKFGMDVYSRQKELPNFSAVGNDDGLFILVSEGRKWYPTEMPAKAFPFSIRFTIEGKIQEASFPNDLS